jgi:hypothetical protein
VSSGTVNAEVRERGGLENAALAVYSSSVRRIAGAALNRL